MDFTKDIAGCLETLAAGGMILYPSDTGWALGCDATNETAVAKIFAAKNEDSIASFAVLVASEREVLRYVTQPDLAVFDYLQEMNQPITVVYEGAIGLASNVLYADGSVAIRICEDEFCKHVIKRFQKPIVCAIANSFGYAAPLNFNAIEHEILQAADYVVQCRQEEVYKTFESPVIKWENNEAIRMNGF